jgi:hypothetical protein
VASAEHKRSHAVLLPRLQTVTAGLQFDIFNDLALLLTLALRMGDRLPRGGGANDLRWP